MWYSTGSEATCAHRLTHWGLDSFCRICPRVSAMIMKGGAGAGGELRGGQVMLG